MNNLHVSDAYPFSVGKKPLRQPIRRQIEEGPLACRSKVASEGVVHLSRQPIRRRVMGGRLACRSKATNQEAECGRRALWPVRSYEYRCLTATQMIRWPGSFFPTCTVLSPQGDRAENIKNIRLDMSID